MPKTKPDDPIRIEREQAWVGDAVLGLFARQWILGNYGTMDAERFTRLTSNHFLSALGNPTAVEAEIGRIYQQLGIDAAFEHIEKRLIPLFRKQEANRNSGSRS